MNAKNSVIINDKPVLWGVPFDNVSMNYAISKARGLILNPQSNSAQLIVTLNAIGIETAIHDEEFADVVKNASMVLADGAGLRIGMSILNMPIQERVAGIDFAEQLCRAASAEGWPVYFCGAAGDTSREAAEVLQERFPGLIIAGTRNGFFDIEDVAKELKDKLIHRHPHVFGNAKIETADDVKVAWDKLKAEEKTERISAMDGLSRAQAALISAQKISKRAVKQGFEWDCEESLYDCINSEFDEFKQAKADNDKEHMEEEFGDILFATVNLARWNKIDAEQALLRANKKFTKRFKKMEELKTKPFEDYSYDEFNNLWKQAKKELTK